MAKRYEYTKIDRNKFGDQVYKTTMYPTIRKKKDDLFIRSKVGDRLDSLAHIYNKNSGLWWIIAQANQIGKGTLVIQPGIQLRIPTDISDVMNELEKENK